jgi:hypothetical protein
MSYWIKFNGITNPSSLRINSVDFSVLPIFTVNYVKLGGAEGKVNTSLTKDGRACKAKVTVIPSTGKTIEQEVQEIIYPWLVGNDWQESTFETSLFRDRVWTGRVMDSVEISDNLLYGTGTISFYFPKPAVAKLPTIATVNTGSRTITFNTAGTAQPYPIFTYTFTQNYTGTVNFTRVDTGQTVSFTGTFVIGDVVTLSNNLLRKNGVIAMGLLNWNSDFFKLNATGTTQITYSLAGTITGEVYNKWY